MNIFARIVVGVDGTEWGFEALRQALVLAKEKPVLHAVTALDTAPAIHAGFRAPDFAELLEKEAEDARDTAETIIGGREGCSASVVRGKPVDVLRRERDELQATLVALGGRRSSRFLGIMLGDTGTELVHDAACSSLLAFPADDRPWRPRKIVVGFDGSTYSRAALRSAEELRAPGVTVEVVTATGGKAIERDAAWADRVETWDPRIRSAPSSSARAPSTSSWSGRAASTASADSAVSASASRIKHIAPPSSCTSREESSADA